MARVCYVPLLYIWVTFLDAQYVRNVEKENAERFNWSYEIQSSKSNVPQGSKYIYANKAHRKPL